MTTLNNNMELWDKVCETNPEWTKRVNQRGGFTTIDAQHQIKRATEEWGPYGRDWGLRNCRFEYIRQSDNGKETILEICLEAEFYYPGGAFVISNDKKYSAGDDNRKKLMTDATTKALSKLGFNSDVFEGKFDDNKYVSDMNKKHGVPEKPAGTFTPPPTAVTPPATRSGGFGQPAAGFRTAVPFAPQRP